MVKKLELRGNLKDIHYRLGWWIENLENEFNQSDPLVHEYLRIADRLKDAQYQIKSAIEITKYEL